MQGTERGEAWVGGVGRAGGLAIVGRVWIPAESSSGLSFLRHGRAGVGGGGGVGSVGGVDSEDAVDISVKSFYSSQELSGRTDGGRRGAVIEDGAEQLVGVYIRPDVVGSLHSFAHQSVVGASDGRWTATRKLGE